VGTAKEDPAKGSCDCGDVLCTEALEAKVASLQRNEGNGSWLGLRRIRATVPLMLPYTTSCCQRRRAAIHYSILSYTRNARCMLSDSVESMIVRRDVSTGQTHLTKASSPQCCTDFLLPPNLWAQHLRFRGNSDSGKRTAQRANISDSCSLVSGKRSWCGTLFGATNDGMGLWSPPCDYLLCSTLAGGGYLG